MTGRRSKITALELCRALRDYFINLHGDGALDALRTTGIKTSHDVGETVDNLVGVNLIRWTEGESREDFADMFDFELEIAKWRHARWGPAWGFALALLALPMLVFAGRELWRALGR